MHFSGVSDICIATNWIIQLSTVCTTQEPFSGFIIVWSRLVEGSGSHMARSEAIIEGLNGLMLLPALTHSL